MTVGYSYIPGAEGDGSMTYTIGAHEATTTFGNSDAQSISYTVVTGSVTITSVDGDVNGDCVVNLLDLIGIRNHLNQDPTTPPGNRVYDVNNDDAIDILDMIFVRNRLNNSCPE